MTTPVALQALMHSPFDVDTEELPGSPPCSRRWGLIPSPQQPYRASLCGWTLSLQGGGQLGIWDAR